MGNERTSEFVDRDGDRYVAQRDGKYLHIHGGAHGDEGCVGFRASDAANVCRMISEAAGIEYTAPDARTITRAEAAEARAAALSEVVDKLAARLGPVEPSTTLRAPPVLMERIRALVPMGERNVLEALVSMAEDRRRRNHLE